MQSIESILNGPEVPRPDIKYGDRTFRFYINIVTPGQQPDKNLSPALDKRTRMARMNNLNMYFEFVRRGFGMIPEMQATISNGEVFPGLVAFYEDTELKNYTCKYLRRAVQSTFPEGHGPFSEGFGEDSGPERELLPSEIGELLDTALEQEQFEYVREFTESRGA